MMQERPVSARPGWPMVLLTVVLALAATGAFILGVRSDSFWLVGSAVVLWTAACVVGVGLFIVNPNEAKMMQFFGSYAGTAREPGLWWANPLYWPKHKISQRVHNFESSKLKVNDHDGNPIEIAAVVAWNVVDTAEAMFEVDDYQNFVRVQTEAAIRNLATTYPYDTPDETQFALRRSNAEVTERLRTEIQERLARAGIQVIKARLSHLAYASEIAGAMLRRQQASAIVAARTQIVAGAVGMVELALDELSRKKVVKLDEERKAAMVSNLLVVLCSDHNAQPIVNAGTLYQ